jgi:hypothetical protein
MAKAKKSAPTVASNQGMELHTGDALTLEGSGITLDFSSVKLDTATVRLDGAPEMEDENSDLSDVDIEQVALDEVNEVLAGFKSRAKQENQRLDDVTDSEFWFAMCFQTRAQKDEFLEKAGWEELGDKYLDGMAVAEIMDIKLESPIPPMPKTRVDQKLIQLATKMVRGG